MVIINYQQIKTGNNDIHCKLKAKLSMFLALTHRSGDKNCFYCIIVFIRWGMIWFVWWCFTTLSTIFQLYRGGQFYWWMKPEDPEKTTDLSQVIERLYHIMLYTSPWSRFELTTSGAIGTDCIGSYKSN
jgi:hypothetical protein